MPGPVSDSYEGPGSFPGADEVKAAIREVREIVAQHIGSPPKPILEVVRDYVRASRQVVVLSERQLRIIRFALGVALEEEDL